MRKLVPALKPYSAHFLALIVFVYIQVMTDLQLPDYMATIVNKGIVLQDNSVIRTTGLQMLLVALLGAVCTIAVSYLASRIATGFSTAVREQVFTQVERFSLAEFNQFSTASLLTRTTNDIQQMQMVLAMLLRFVLMAPIMGIGGIIKATHSAPSLTWLLALAIAIMLSVLTLVFAIGLPKFRQVQKLLDRLNLVSRQLLTGLRVIRAFHAEAREEQSFDTTNRDLTRVNLFVNRLMVFMQPFIMLLFNITALAVIWFGAQLIDREQLLIGNMIAFMQYAMQVIFAFLMVSMVFIMLPRAAVSAARVAEVLEATPSITDPPDPKTWSNKQRKGKVEFRNVTFTYTGAEEPVLEHISFTAEPGQTTAFIGSTGSGKSTLINLIPRFYDVTAGSILIDDIDIRQVKLSELYERLGYVPQKGVLFSGTIRSNITYGAPGINEQKVQQVAHIAQAQDFIDATPDRYETAIAQNGTNVSGGQRQRLAIARALARDPDILIFDDSFSAVDFKTDAALRAALRKNIRDKTVLIVAQRINTILHADQIIVLDKGKIVGTGTHAELLTSCQVYREIAQSQLTDEELAAAEKKTAQHVTTSKEP